MSEQRTALIIVDVQRDFIDGALGGENRDGIIPALVEAARHADLVVASADWHPAKHCSFVEQGGPWPIHCVIGTPGAEIHPVITASADVIVRKGQALSRDAYSAFQGVTGEDRTLSELLKQDGIERVIVGGLCTDYCVKATALDAVANGYRTELLKNGHAGVASDTTEQALAEMEQAGIRL